MKTYAVTGCSNGIGASVAGLLKAHGHTVVGLDIVRPAEALDQFIALDLEDPASIAAAAAAVPGGLAGLANIAGLSPRPDQAARILAVNYHGQRRMTRALLDKLAPGASIVNLASRAGRAWRDNVDQVKRLTEATDMDAFVAAEGIDPTRAYNLSKEAIILWTMAESEGMVARGFRINSVSPSAVETRLLPDFLAALGPQVVKNVTRVGRPGTAQEVAEVVGFLLDDRSAWVRGTDIHTDGGLTAFQMADLLDLGGLKL